MLRSTSIAFLVIAFLATTHATTFDDKHVSAIGDQTIINYVRMVLEKIQGIIINGNPLNGVPPKDPINMGDYYQTWNDTDEITGATANIYNMIWTGLAGFTINEVSFDNLGQTGYLNITIPLMDVRGDYYAQGSVSGNPQTTANGSFDVNMNGATLNASLALGIDDNSTFHVTDMRIEFTIANTQVIMSNLQGDPQLEAQLQQNAVDLYNHIFSLIKPKLDSVAVSLAGLIDAIVSGITGNGFEVDTGLLMWKLNKLGRELGFA